ncbi:MAG: hypothetical protein KBD39_11640 [Sterolibacterium sp.]|nr:hypothetical protein [Sterolibacterium sp.]
MMHGITELQLSLIVIGVLSVGGVWAYNAWQERRHRRLAHEAFRNQQKDILTQRMPADGYSLPTLPALPTLPTLAGERIEPVLGLPQDGVMSGDEPVISRAPLPLEDDGTPVLDSVVEMTEETEGGAASVLASALNPPGREEPTAAEASGATGATEATEIGLLPEAAFEAEPHPELADTLVDCIVRLTAADMISAPLFWAAQRKLLSRLAGRLCWSGLDENTGRWQRLHAQDANSYRRLVAALQLVDRNGQVPADDVALFCDGLRQLAAHYNASIIVPVVSEVVARARGLDEFCASVDWRLSLHLVHGAGAALRLDDIERLAAMAGLKQGTRDEGYCLHAYDQYGQTQFTLSLSGMPESGQEAGADAQEDAAGQLVGGMNLTIDVPRVTDGVAAYDRMLHLAGIMAGKLGVVVVDDQRRSLSDEVLGRIRAKIGEFQQKMTERQIPAGSRRALRLYA